jgi:hypothetical protein
MARIEIDPNYSTPTFPRATAATDIFKKEDIQQLAAAISTHDHGSGKGLAVTAVNLAPGSVPGSAIADGSITSAKIADGTIQTLDIADGAITSAKIADGTIVGGDIANGTITAAKIAQPLTKSWVVQAAPAGNTSSTTPVAMPSPLAAPDMSLTGYTGGRLLIAGGVNVIHSTTNGTLKLQIRISGSPTEVVSSNAFPVGGNAENFPFVFFHSGGLGGTPTVGLYWSTTSGQLTMYTSISSWLIVTELV